MLSPLAEADWTREKAAHLLNRAGFSGPPEEIDALHSLGAKNAVKQLLDGAAAKLEAPAPKGIEARDMLALRQSMRSLEEEARRERKKELQQQERQSARDLCEWWLLRMRGKTGDPVAEKLTLFWHGHFATSIVKVRQPFLMWQQNDTLRRNALGDFGTLTKAVARDPAMLVWLDTARSRAQKPNENFARELMELFTLGEGHYTEDDIRAAARTFTTYKIDPRTQTFRFERRQASPGPVSIFGRTGDFSGDDVVDLILEKPECAAFIARKLWVFYASGQPDEKLVQELASGFRESGYRIRPLLETIFNSAAFYSPAALSTQIKSPVQWVMTLARTLEVGLPPGRILLGALDALGQEPFRPPSVKGWDGGKAWINTATLLLRYNMAAFAVGNETTGGRPFQGGRGARRFQEQLARQLPLDKIAPPELRQVPEKLAARMADRLFQRPLKERETTAFARFAAARDVLDDQAVRDLLQLMMSTPQYQIT